MSETATITNERRSELELKVRAIVDSLPQREAIREGDINHWIPHVVGNYGELAIWHARRAGGFGGSQIGALVRNFMGQRADHEASAHDIVSGTLLRKVPDEPNGHMRRGIAMEAEHRKWFYRKYDAVRNAPAFEALSSGVGPRAWMRYSPDEVATMFDPSGMSREKQTWLGDYKAPSQVDPDGGVAFQYVCQLHMGRMVCAHNKVKIDGMILSQFDWQNWEIKDDVIAYNPDLDPLITAAGDHFWDYVMRGEIPPYVRKERLDDAKGLVEEIGDDSYRLARLKALAKQFELQADALQECVAAKVSKYRFGSSKLVVDASLSITAAQVFDPEAVRAFLTEEMVEKLPLKARSSSKFDQDLLVKRVRETLSPGQKISAFYAPGNFEAEPLYQALVGAGVDADALMKEQIRISVTPSVKADTENFINREFAELIAPASSDEEANRGVEGDAGHAPRFLSA